MKKITLLLMSLTTVFSSFSATGWFQDYVQINVNGAGISAPTGWYWIGTDPGYATPLDGQNFGTVSSLVLTGCDMKYWDDTQNRTGGALYYKIMTADNTTEVISPVEIIWDQTYVSGNDYQGTKTVSINILAGLSSNTTYKLHI